MPAKKPRVLITRDETNAAREARLQSERALSPKSKLSRKPPARLRGHKIASAAWTRLIDLYDAVDGQIVTAFDQDLLITYCMVLDEAQELRDLIVSGKKLVDDFQKQARKFMRENELEPRQVQKIESLIFDLQEMVNIKLDARLDGKGKFGHLLAQELFLTPRSRGGVAPPEKIKVIETEMSRLIDV